MTMRYPRVVKPPPGGGAIGDIEVLRACAVLLVLADHLFFLFPWTSPAYQTFSRFAAPWGGVDLFFAISGFVIARSLFSAAPAAGGFLAAAAPFWIRRAWRIWPTAWLWSGLALLASAFFADKAPGANALAPVWPEWVSAMLQVINLRFAACGSSCPPGSVFFTVYWSLSLEEQFYILLPFVMLLAPRRWLVPLLVALFAAQVVIPRPQTPANWLWFLRTDAIILGVLIAIGHARGMLGALEPAFLRHRRTRWALIPMLIVFISTLPLTGVPISTGLLAIVSGALVFIASFDADYIMRKGGAKRLMSWIGARSFGIYLVHLPAFSLTRFWYATINTGGGVYGESYFLQFLVSGLAVTVLLAEANYRLVETPLRTFGKGVAGRVGARLAAGPERVPEPSPVLATVGLAAQPHD